MREARQALALEPTTIKGFPWANRQCSRRDQLLIDMIKVKGVFDGSQRHIARIYLKGNIGYFKLNCYSRRMMLEHALEFFDISTNAEQVFIP